MNMDTILEASKRLIEPSVDGIYYVYNNWFSKNPKFITKIVVYHGPKGGYKRPVYENDRRKKYYWKTGDIWLTEKEHENNISGNCDSDDCRNILFEKILVEHVVLSELRDIYRKKWIEC